MSTFRRLNWPERRQECRPEPKRKKPKKKPKKKHYRYCREKKPCQWGRQFIKKEKKNTYLVLCLNLDLCLAQTTEPQKIILEDEQVVRQKKYFHVDATKLVNAIVINLVEGLKELLIADRAKIPMSIEEISNFAQEIGRTAYREAKEDTE